MARLQLEEDLEREKEAENVYEEMLQQEAARLEESDYEPKVGHQYSSYFAPKNSCNVFSGVFIC